MYRKKKQMKIITSEAVFRGHPDKICDQISDAILDECLRQDKNARVAVECLIKNKLIVIAGEITANAETIAEYLGIKSRTVRDRVNEFADEYSTHKGIITRHEKTGGKENDN